MIYKYDDKEVFIEVTGKGEAVLLLHGWGCTHDIFKSLASLLATQYRVYSFDFPGFGASQEPDEVWGVEEYTRLVEKFVKDNAIESPALVGHSFGGRVSLLYSSRNSVSKVVLVDAAGIKPKRSWKYYYKVYTYKCAKWLCNTLLPKEKAEAALNRLRKYAGSSDYNNASPMMRRILSKVVNED
ncbi:MAG: alpha/beta hydrolase [Bacteroidaceae bacterium]|nr:alpha/beta hydrolase [Bacteroidaceae bacterium]